jgi:hypothetical protein
VKNISLSFFCSSDSPKSISSSNSPPLLALTSFYAKIKHINGKVQVLRVYFHLKCNFEQKQLYIDLDKSHV